jgi:WD40 repeat protein
MQNGFFAVACLLFLMTQCFAQPAPSQEKDAAPTIEINAVRFSPDGKTLATSATKTKNYASVGREVALWNVATGDVLHMMKSDAPNEMAVAIAFSPDGKIVADLSIATQDNKMGDSKIALWEVSSGKLLRLLQIPQGEVVLSLAFSPDGKTLVGGSGNEKNQPQTQVNFWDAETGKSFRTFKGLQGCPCGLAFSSDGKQLAASGWKLNGAEVLGAEVKIWDLASSQVKHILTADKVVVEKIIFSPDGKILATAGNKIEKDNGVGDGDVKLWDVETAALKYSLMEEERTPQYKRQNAEFLAFAPNGKTLYGGGMTFDQKFGSEIWAWDAETGKLLRTFAQKQINEIRGHALVADLSPDGKVIAFANEIGEIQIISSKDGSLIRSFQK